LNGVIICKINHRTKIYIAVGADPEEARTRYWARQDTKGKVMFASKKPVVTLAKE
jgi:hypothetical protein